MAAQNHHQNQVLKLLNIKQLFRAFMHVDACLPKVASDRCPEMDPAEQAVVNKYCRALLLYSKCHNVFNEQGYHFADDVATLCKLNRFTYLYIIYLHLCKG